MKSLSAALVVALAALAAAGCASAPPGCAARVAYAGLEDGTVQALRFDECAGRLAGAGEAARVPRPRWLLARAPMLYAASDEDGREGRVFALRADRDATRLEKVNDAGAGGVGTTHLALDAPSATLLAANFNAGSASSLAVGGDGSLGALASTVKDTGSGPHRRQAGPRAHAIAVDPSGRFALVADMGADRVFVYGFGRATRQLTPQPVSSLALPPGSGPRHLAFDRSGRYVYLVTELTAEVVALRWSEQDGRLAALQSLPTSQAASAEARSASEIATGADGRFVYVANRTEGALLVYRIDPAGTLALVQSVPSGGTAPWTFAIDRSGRWLLAANFHSKDVSLFGIDARSGELSPAGPPLAMPAAPLSLAFME